MPFEPDAPIVPGEPGPPSALHAEKEEVNEKPIFNNSLKIFSPVQRLSAVCAPLPYLTAVKDALKGSKVGLGAQDCYADADAGAFTGATSTAMLESAAPHVHIWTSAGVP